MASLMAKPMKLHQEESSRAEPKNLSWTFLIVIVDPDENSNTAMIPSLHRKIFIILIYGWFYICGERQKFCIGTFFSQATMVIYVV